MPGFKQVFVQALTEVSPNLKDALGDVRIEGAKHYRYVKVRNTVTVAGVAGDPICYATAAASEEDGTSACAIRLADTAGVFAGLLMAPVAGVAATDYYCWVQFRGPALSNPAVAGTAGQGFKMGAEKAWAVGAAVTDYIVGTVANVAGKRIILSAM